MYTKIKSIARAISLNYEINGNGFKEKYEIANNDITNRKKRLDKYSFKNRSLRLCRRLRLVVE